MRPQANGWTKRCPRNAGNSILGRFLDVPLACALIESAPPHRERATSSRARHLWQGEALAVGSADDGSGCLFVVREGQGGFVPSEFLVCCTNDIEPQRGAVPPADLMKIPECLLFGTDPQRLPGAGDGLREIDFDVGGRAERAVGAIAGDDELGDGGADAAEQDEGGEQGFHGRFLFWELTVRC